MSWKLMMSDESFLRRTFELAQMGEGKTWPNPMVGAVIVKDNKIIGEGFHSKQGAAHAELDAINKVRENPAGSTIYVNLEPCCHTDKTTPPCAQRLIKEGFKKVVISNLDPNPAVNGKGVELLRENGIEVVYGILPDEGEKLNEVFFLSQRKKRPFFHFKSAVTLDGKTALTNGESKWITGEAARLEVHRMRSLHQAILVGGETARKDNPKLTVRLPGHEGQMPWRIVVSKSGKLPVTHHLFSDDFAHRTIFYTQNDPGFNFPGKVMVNSLQDVLDDLFQRKIINVMLECGPTLATEFLKSGFIDRMTLFQNPSIVGVGRNLFDDINLLSLDKRPLLTDIESRWIGNDHALTGRFKCLQD